MRELRNRILTAVILAPPVLAAVWFGGWWFLALLAFLGLMLAWEWSQLFSEKTLPLLASLHIAALIGVFLLLSLNPFFHIQSLLIIALACAGSLSIAWIMGLQKYLALLGPAYLILPLVLLADLRADASYGASAALILLLMVWASDSGAYFTGRLIGGPLLLPKISARKTYSGALGGIVATMLTGYGASFFAGHVLMLLSLGAIISIAVQAGDFFESFIKRKNNLKDTGHSLPGHGGFLDRVDGLIAAVFVFYIFAWMRGWPDISAAQILLNPR